jgi:CHASE3 domain sensor protein
MKNLRIRTKLMVCFGGIIVLMFCIAGFSMSALGKVNHMVAIVAEDRLLKVLIGDEINGAMSDYRVAEEMHVLSTDDAHMTAAEAAMRSRKQVIDADLARLKPIVKLPAGIAALNRLRDYWLQYENVNSQVLAL